MESKQVFGVIFDMDGVLVDSRKPHFESWRQVAREFGRDMTEAEFADTFGRTNRDIVHFLWGKSVSDDEIQKIGTRKEAVYRDIITKNIPAVPGLHQLLPSLCQAGAKLAVGSSGPIENVNLVLDGLGIREHFSAIVSSADVTEGKPNPQVFLTAAKKLGFEPKRCVVIEDAPAGIEAGHRGGMKVIALTTSYSPDKISNADKLCCDLTEVNVELISSLIY
jgi:beta-phosphoglucomutase